MEFSGRKRWNFTLILSSPVKIRFGLEQIATLVICVGIISTIFAEQHIQNVELYMEGKFFY